MYKNVLSHIINYQHVSIALRSSG